MSEQERRRQDSRADATLLRDELNENQCAMLDDLERFGWTLRFIRRPADGDIVPVAQPAHDDADFAVLREDGRMDQPAGFVLRKPRG